MSNNNYSNVNNLSNNNGVVRLQYANFVDPTFWQEENEGEPEDYVIVEGQRVPAITTLKELGLEVSNSEDNAFSDPGARNLSNSNNNRRRIRKQKRLTKKVQRKRKSAKKPTNNRFGFKKALKTLRSGFKKLTGKRRR